MNWFDVTYEGSANEKKSEFKSVHWEFKFSADLKRCTMHNKHGKYVKRRVKAIKLHKRSKYSNGIRSLVLPFVWTFQYNAENCLWIYIPFTHAIAWECKVIFVMNSRKNSNGFVCFVDKKKQANKLVPKWMQSHNCSMMVECKTCIKNQYHLFQFQYSFHSN